jgi:hypothetical protein
MMAKTRKLYQIRQTPAGHTFGRTVGHKAQLKPRAVAARIAARLRKAGVDARISLVLVNTTPEQDARISLVLVNTTPEQDAYLARRY